MFSSQCGYCIRGNLPRYSSGLRREAMAWLKLTLDLTQDKWSAVYSVQTILLSLQSLLGGRKKKLIEVYPSLILYSRAKQCISLEHGRIKPLGISRVWVDPFRYEPYLIPEFSVQGSASEVLPTNQWWVDSLRMDRDGSIPHLLVSCIIRSVP
jgi:hypothetical protein